MGLLPRTEQRRIERAIKRDELLQDPDEAQTLVVAAERLRRKGRHYGFYALLGVVSAAGGVATAVAESSRTPLWFTLPWVVGLIGLEVWRNVDHHRSSERWARAEARHVEYLQQLGVPAWRSPAG